MAVIKCPVCGGELDLNDDATIGKCRYCDSTIAVPKNFEKKQNLYNRATFYRQSNEYDKAIVVYEDLLKEDSKDAEAHFGLLLSKYGIEYVEDPKTGERKPTCHRLQKTSILKDPEYIELLECADSSSKYVYEEKINEIAEIQERILKISKTEPPYDIFICYKETDENGDRTVDSVLAQDIYNELIKKYKVFFARKTLESKLGGEYEPIIFAALNSAKVMIVVGARKENFEAVWVKNEWSRFLAMAKDGFDKTTIPVYKGISPYELPMELSNLQGLDASKIGFKQDLLDGIEKCLKATNNKKTEEKQRRVDYNNIEYLLHNGEVFLKLNNYEKARSNYEQITNRYPDDYRGWFGLLIATTHDFRIHIKKNDSLQKQIKVWNSNIKKLCNKQELSDVKHEIAERLMRNEKELVDDDYLTDWYYWIMRNTLDPNDYYFNAGQIRTQTKWFKSVAISDSLLKNSVDRYKICREVALSDDEKRELKEILNYLKNVAKFKSNKYQNVLNNEDSYKEEINKENSGYILGDNTDTIFVEILPTILAIIFTFVLNEDILPTIIGDLVFIAMIFGKKNAKVAKLVEKMPPKIILIFLLLPGIAFLLSSIIFETYYLTFSVDPLHYLGSALSYVLILEIIFGVFAYVFGWIGAAVRNKINNNNNKRSNAILNIGKSLANNLLPVDFNKCDFVSEFGNKESVDSFFNKLRENKAYYDSIIALDE